MSAGRAGPMSKIAAFVSESVSHDPSAGIESRVDADSNPAGRSGSVLTSSVYSGSTQPSGDQDGCRPSVKNRVESTAAAERRPSKPGGGGLTRRREPNTTRAQF